MIFSQYVFYNFVQRVIVRIDLKTKISVSQHLQRFGRVPGRTRTVDIQNHNLTL